MGLAAALLPQAATAGSPGLGPGCDTSRHAVAHHAGGSVVTTRSSTGSPVPCETYTGFGGAETRVAVTADGTVVYEPATLTPGLAGTGFVPGAPNEYRSGAAWVTGRDAVIVGPTGSNVSQDRGHTWTRFDTGSFDTIDCARPDACWASGEQGRAAHLVATH